MKYKDTAIRVLVEFCRLFLGVVFIFSGFVKAVDPMGGAIKITDYLISFGLAKMQPFAVLFSFNLSALEFTLGVCILLGIYRRYTSLLILIFMAFMTPLTLYLALFNPVSDCGCFGDALILTNWQTFYKNIVLSAAAIIVFIYSQRLLRCYTYKAYWFVALYTYLCAIGFAYFNYYHLPVIDFRPYKVGANIPSLMKIPEGAPVDEYKYTLIYEKNKIRKSFTLNDYPANDTTWKFVETKTELLKKGYVPPIAAFNIYDPDGDDVTDKLLSNPSLSIFLISPKLEDANDDKMDEINNIYDYALEEGIPFYCVTGSSQKAINVWCDNTGAEYPFRMADEVLLKTMIRSNPGIILLRQGSILAKWHYNDFPSEEKLKGVMHRYLPKAVITKKDNNWIRTGILVFGVPLLFVWLYDFLYVRKKVKKKE